MNGFRRLSISAMALISFMVFSSQACAYKKPSSVPFADLREMPSAAVPTLYAHSKEASAGRLTVFAKKPLLYTFESPLALHEQAALELEYVYSDYPPGSAQVVLTIEGEDSWLLPPHGGFLGIGTVENQTIRYRIPIHGRTISNLQLQWDQAQGAGQGVAPSKNPSNNNGEPHFFKIISFSLVPRLFGYKAEAGSVLLTPFVSRRTEGGTTLTVDPPQKYRTDSRPTLQFSESSRIRTVSFGERVYRLTIPASMPAQGLSIGPGNIGDAPYPIVLAIQGSELPSMALLEAKSAAGSSSSVPIPADPGLILSYDREAWRDERYEVFRWVQFPSILIFDTADYAIQERLFKRLAFFVEKAGFRGRLAKDEEIAHLHGWNAHDYRSEDLAAFYELALRTQFPLNREELELRDLLLDTGVLERGANGSGFRAGSGAVISISRESESYLRHLFMVHEAFHGLHFIDADFREFARNRYENLDPTAKRFVHSYFSFLRYDVKDSYLMSNELMAYCLQQPVAGAAAYFGEIVARRLDTDPLRRSVLPPKDTEAGNWPEIARLFDGEARAFSSYAEKRWGLAAGRVWSVYQISRAKLTL